MTWWDWARQHGRLFGLSGEAHTEMLAGWCDRFAAAGYTADELARATDWLAVNAPPRFPSEHLAALHERLCAQRAEQAARQPPEERWPPCALCGSTGRVLVPSLAALARGRWGTAAVLCRCPLGRWYRERQRGERQQLTLEHYEALRPGWRAEMDLHARALAARAARPLSARWDEAVRKALAAVRHARTAPPPA